MKSNLQFRLGLLDGIQDRQTGTRRDTAKLARVKSAKYSEGYLKGLMTVHDINKTIEKGNRK